MSGRMTDERLANLQKWLGAEHGDHPVTLELLQALTAERKWVRTGPTANMLRVEELEATLARVRGLLRVAKCPACDGSGAIPDGVHGCYQCQWCDERNQATGEGK